MSAIHLLSKNAGALQLVGGAGRLLIGLDANGQPMIPRAYEKRLAEAIRMAIADDTSTAIMAPDEDDLEFGCLITVRRAREPDHALVSMIDLKARPGRLTAAMLMDMFGLTRSEAKVALELYVGREADEIADLRDVSIGTVRSQVKSLLSKTKSRNQKRLVALFSRIALSLPDHAADSSKPDDSQEPKRNLSYDF